MTAASYATAVLADSPWGFWKSDEASGTTLADASGNSRPMTVTGSSSITYAQLGPDSTTNDAIQWAWYTTATNYANTSATHATSNATIEVWYYYPGATVRDFPILCHATGYGSGTFDKCIWIDTSGNLVWYCYNGSVQTLTTTTPLTANTWHHIVVSVGAAGQKIRVDKVTVATNSGVTSSYTGSAQQAFLHGGGSGFVDLTQAAGFGLSGPAAFWTSQLTDAQTDAHYDAMMGGGVTRVSATLAESWAVTGRASGTLAESWATNSFIVLTNPWASGTLQHTAERWNVVTTTSRVTGTLSETWAVGGRVNKTLSETWNVSDTTRVNGTLGETWNVSARVTGSLSETWAVNARVSGSLAESWSVGGRVSGSLSESWTVGNRVQKTTSETWNVTKRTFKGLAETWSVTTRATGNTTTETWNIAGRVQSLVVENWSINQRLAALQAQSWSVNQRILETLVEQWTVGGRVQGTEPSSWDVRCFQAWDGAEFKDIEWLGLWDGETLQPADIALWDGSSLVPFD